MDRATKQIIGGSLAFVLLLAGAALMYYQQVKAGAILLATAAICLGFTFGRLGNCGYACGVRPEGESYSAGSSRGKALLFLAIALAVALAVAGLCVMQLRQPNEVSAHGDSAGSSVLIASSVAVASALAAASATRRRQQG